MLYKGIPFLTVSESTKKELIEWDIPKNNITVINNGTDIPKYKLPKKEKTTTVSYLGSLAKDKGIEDAIEAFSLINKKMGDKKIMFWVMGNGEKKYLQFLKRKANKKGLKDNIIFWGFVNEKKKYELLSKSHVLLNPSIREGWGLVVIEAASVGTQTISYDVSGLRDSIINGKTGVICREHSPKNMAEEAIRFVSSKEKYPEYVKNAKDWAKRFSWKKSVDKSIKLIRIIGKNHE